MKTKDSPPISCICLADDRLELLEEAVYSFLHQDYQGRKELVILNDQKRQTLEFEHPEVEIFNLPQRFRTTGEKRNAAVALCSHALIFVWDVEDIHLPHRLSVSVENFDETIGFFKSKEAFVWGNGRLSGLQKSVFHNGSCWSRDRFDQIRGYDYLIDYGYDQEFEHQLGHKNGDSIGHGDTAPTSVYCIYRWQYKSHSRAMYLHRRSALPRGNVQAPIKLNPHWRFDYTQQVRDYLATMIPLNRFQDSGKTTNNIRVDFLVAGAQKSGTTALDEYLRLHPEICMAGRKEVHFFDNERIFEEGNLDFTSPTRFFPWLGLEGCNISVPDDFSGDKYDLYHAFFSPRPPQRLCGEASPTYMFWYDAPRRIWEYNPAMKFIIILRNPIDRAYSQWNMRRIDRREHRSFRVALKKEVRKSNINAPRQTKGNIIARGFYTEQIRLIWHYFPKEQTLILKTEELRHEPQSTIDKVYDFLGVARINGLPEKNVYSTPYAAPMSGEDRDFLKKIYYFEIRKLERLLGWDCREWLCDHEG